jgi:hypothetical protein
MEQVILCMVAELEEACICYFIEVKPKFSRYEFGNMNIYYSDVSGGFKPVLVGEQHVYGLSVHSDSQKAVAAISKLSFLSWWIFQSNTRLGENFYTKKAKIRVK